MYQGIGRQEGFGRGRAPVRSLWLLGIVLITTLGFVTPTNALSLSSAAPYIHPSSVVASMASSAIDLGGSFVATPGVLAGSELGGIELGPANLKSSATVVITLNVKDPGELALFDAEVSDPSSPIYAHFLSLSQFESIFSPSTTVQASVISWLTSNGLSVVYASPDRLTVEVTGSLGEFSQAFHTPFSRFLRSDGTTFWAPSGPVLEPSTLAPWILGVEGMNDIPSSIHTEVSTAASPGQGVMDWPEYMHQIYQLDQMYNSTGNASHGIVPSFATGVKIAQTLWSNKRSDCGYSTTDMNEFYNLSDGYWNGFPKPIIQPHYNVPGYKAPSPPGTGTCGDTELTLDMEYSGSDAPGAFLDPTWVNSASNAALEALLSWLLTNVPDLNVITQSWGGNDVNMTSGSFEAVYEQDYQQATALGISLFASSADGDGSISGGASCGSPGTPGLDFPGSSPYVMSVGGTANMVTDSTTYADDSGSDVWNWCAAGLTTFAGSQGGVSAAFPKAAYQIGYAVNSSMGNAIAVTRANGGTTWSATSARPDPDWSGPGADMAFWIKGAWNTQGYGGTSFSSPATAGLTGAMMVFDGHKLGQLGPAFYSLMFQFLYRQPNNVLDPTYMIENGSNAFFNAAQYYNTSTGYGIPMAYNLSLDLGKPFIATNPEGAATVGTSYPITSTVKDIQSVKYVNVSYLAPAGSWQNATLSLSSSSGIYSTWTGSIPGSSLTTTGTLKYCVYATDKNLGNSWSPYNLSAWAITGNVSHTFGCTVPFTVNVGATPGTIAINSLTGNRSSINAETNYALCFNVSYSTTGLTAPFYLNWTWADGSKTSAVTSSSPAMACHMYSAAVNGKLSVYVNSSKNIKSATASTTVRVYLHVQASFTTALMNPVVPANETFQNTSKYGYGSYALSWSFGDGNASTLSTPPFQIYYKPGTYTITLTVIDSLAYTSTATFTLHVWGSTSFPLPLLPGWNLVSDPLVANSYSLYEISHLIGPSLVSMQRMVGTALTNYSISGINDVNGSAALAPGDGLWVDVSATVTVTIWGNASATLAGVSFGSGWSGIGWSITSTTTASTLAGKLTGCTAMALWNATAQSWEVYIVGFSPSVYDFAISQGMGVYIWTPGSGTLSEP